MKIYKYFLPILCILLINKLEKLFIVSKYKNLRLINIGRKNGNDHLNNLNNKEFNDESDDESNENNNGETTNDDDDITSIPFSSDKLPEYMQCIVEYIDEYNINRGDNWLVHTDTLQYANSNLIFPNFKYFIFAYPDYKPENILSINCVNFDEFINFNITCIECIKFHRNGKYGNGILMKSFQNDMLRTPLTADRCLNLIKNPDSNDESFLRSFCLSFKFS